ncbi:hypothetical protein V8E51_012024 [Hyaloscypha variabilis]
MADKVLPSIETAGSPLSVNGSIFSDDTYVEPEGTPEPDDPEGRLAWGRRHYGEHWYLDEVARREAAWHKRREEEERERIELEKADAIRRLQETEPWEYERRMRELNLQLHGFTKEQIDKANQPLSEEEIKRNLESFSARLLARTLQPTTTDSATRRRSKRAAPTLTEAPVEEESASNATNVKAPQSKHDKTRQRKAYKGERASRRLANKPVEYGIFAKRSMAPVPKDLQRNPSTRKRNLAGPRSKKRLIAVEPANHRGGLKSGRGGTHRSRSKKQSGG